MAILVYHYASRGLDAEETYQADIEVLDIVTTYLKNNPQWPKSWDDLERTAMPLQSHADAVPSLDELAEWKKRVYIDFSLTREDVAAMNLENFTAIQPIGPSFGPPETHIEPLLKAARQRPK